MPVTREKRESFANWITDSGKKGGHAIAAYNGDDTWLSHGPLRIPFVSPTVTWATTGGMPIGHIGRWYGPEHSGKSLTNWGLIYCAQHYPEVMTQILEREILFWQKRNKFKAAKIKKRLKEAVDTFPDGMSVCLFDTEQRAQLEFAAQLGVDLNKDKFILIEENVVEEIAWQMAQAVEAYHLVLVDSASNTQSYAEANLEPGAYEQGTAAQAWKRLRQVRRKLDRQQNTIVIVDQMRMQLGQRHGSPKAKPPQNRFLKHNASIAIEFDEGKKLYLNKNLSLTDKRENASDDFKSLGTDWPEVAGMEMRCRVEKNSTGKPFRHGVMRFKFPMADARTGELIQETGFDEAFELLQAAEYFHLIESGGGGMFYLLDDNFEHTRTKWKGEWNAAQGIMEDEELRDRILMRLRLAI
jgi:RecA/RadA recombinase